MRVIDCNECGETIKGANDDELRSAFARHMEAEHPDVEVDGEELVASQAYDATDS
jgi:hypothetical protein